MIDQHITKAVADLAVFLEFSGEDILDPDASIEALEQLALNLQLAKTETKVSLTNTLISIAKDYGEHQMFIENLPETLAVC
jgi:hypothetical protein